MKTTDPQIGFDLVDDSAQMQCVDSDGVRADAVLELSVVIPCLNEAETIGACIERAQRALRERDLHGEVLIADNGSSDGSVAIATQLGARVIHVPERGYGNALMEGIEAARGQYVIMGDADGSYDFLEIPKFVDKLRDGFELVMGCRLPQGGGRIMPDAMPRLHRIWGNPMFSAMVRWMFQAPIHDVYCGLRGFSKELYHDLQLRCTGMEFATEMVVKSSLFGRRITELPITLHPDGRKLRAPHLRTFRDGWRTLRFFLMYSPRWLFLVPGMLMIALGGLGYCLAFPFPGATIFGATLDAHTLLFASLAILLGYQSVLFAVCTKTFAVTEGLLPHDPQFSRLFRYVNLERGLAVGILGFVAGLLLLGAAVNEWRVANFGALDYPRTMRLVVPGVTLAALGFQTILGSFFVSILGLSRK